MSAPEAPGCPSCAEDTSSGAVSLWVTGAGVPGEPDARGRPDSALWSWRGPRSGCRGGACVTHEWRGGCGRRSRARVTGRSWRGRPSRPPQRGRGVGVVRAARPVSGVRCPRVGGKARAVLRSCPSPRCGRPGRCPCPALPLRAPRLRWG